ncbi:DUF4190 domain-containing protein [Leucobacter sp. NPDC058333]|uniref:DUF4190 domain-containing protein n=1 Tax=Leucobacter sp. NPDC058333 TaxID=3346450 RepID=UPI00365735D7
MSATITHESTASATSQGTVPAAPRARGFAITSLVLGIASVVSGWTFFAPIAGIIFGVSALRRDTTERAVALWGVWLNVVMLALWAITAVVLVAVFGIGFGALAVFSTAG